MPSVEVIELLQDLKITPRLVRLRLKTPKKSTLWVPRTEDPVP